MTKNESTQKPKEKESQYFRPPTFSKIYATNVRGGMTSQDFRVELMNEKIKNPAGEEAYICDAMIILSPIGAKRLLKLLQKSVDEFEKEKGEIPLNPKDDIFI